MEIVLVVVGSIIVLVVSKQIMNRLTSPVVKAASKHASQLRIARLIARKLPEGQLFNIRDLKVMEVGEAMLLDGVSTVEINNAMLDMLTEKGSSVNALMSTTPSTIIQTVGH
jgi:hypothetical protein